MGRFTLCLFLFGITHLGVCQAVRSDIRVADSLRLCVIQTAESQTFVREPRNMNDHPAIIGYFDACKMDMRKARWNHKPWCAAFVTWVLKQCGVAVSYVRGSLAAVASWNAATAKHRAPGQNAETADVVTYKYWSHIEIVKEWPKNPRIPIFYAIGGNTSAGNPQHGVYTNIPRRKNSVRAIIKVL